MRTYRFQGELVNFDPRKGGVGKFARVSSLQGVHKNLISPESEAEVHPAGLLTAVRSFIYKDIDKYRGKFGSSPEVHLKFTNGRLMFTDFISKFTLEVGRG